jgi:hypothetical protein
MERADRLRHDALYRLIGGHHDSNLIFANSEETRRQYRAWTVNDGGHDDLESNNQGILSRKLALLNKLPL